MIPKGFIPNEDTGQIFAFTEAAQDVSFDAMMAEAARGGGGGAEEPLRAGVLLGHRGQRVEHGAEPRAHLHAPQAARRSAAGAEQIIDEMRPQFAQVPGIKVYPQILPPIRIGGQLTKGMYQYTLQDADLKALYHWAPLIYDRMRGLPGFLDVNTDLQITSPQVRVEIDRDKASALGVTAEQIESALDNAYGAPQVSTIYTPSNQYWVIMELAARVPEGPRGAVAPLRPLVQRQAGPARRRWPGSAAGIGPLTVNHLGQLPAVTPLVQPEPGVALGEAVTEINELQRELDLPATLTRQLPGHRPGLPAVAAGTRAPAPRRRPGDLSGAGILYESFIHPLTILSGLPSAGLGALLTLILFSQELNLYGFVGVIMLIGIVKKNAIMMIDFAHRRAAQRGARPARPSTRAACSASARS